MITFKTTKIIADFVSGVFSFHDKFLAVFVIHSLQTSKDLGSGPNHKISCTILLTLSYTKL